MSTLFSHLYGKEKVASEEDISLDDISAADFLEAVEAGYFEDEDDLSEFSNDELLAALDELDDGEDHQKLAADADYWETAGRVFARSYLGEIQKVASAEESDYDLNNLSVEEFINLAAAIEQEMEY